MEPKTNYLDTLTDFERQTLEWGLDDFEVMFKEHMESAQKTFENPHYGNKPGDLKERFGPGTVGCMQTGHLAYVLAETWEQYMITDPAVLLDERCRRLAFIAHQCMLAVYNELMTSEFRNEGTEHADVD
jgi:hypothetical protein